MLSVKVPNGYYSSSMKGMNACNGKTIGFGTKSGKSIVKFMLTPCVLDGYELGGFSTVSGGWGVSYILGAKIEFFNGKELVHKETIVC